MDKINESRDKKCMDTDIQELISDDSVKENYLHFSDEHNVICKDAQYPNVQYPNVQCREQYSIGNSKTDHLVDTTDSVNKSEKWKELEHCDLFAPQQHCTQPVNKEQEKTKDCADCCLSWCHQMSNDFMLCYLNMWIWSRSRDSEAKTSNSSCTDCVCTDCVCTDCVCADCVCADCVCADCMCTFFSCFDSS
jgi:hypothetical protein